MLEKIKKIESFIKNNKEDIKKEEIKDEFAAAFYKEVRLRNYLALANVIKLDLMFVQNIQDMDTVEQLADEIFFTLKRANQLDEYNSLRK